MSNELNFNIYNPTDERMCQGCYQKFETQEGILESSYRFTCPPCNKFYKYQSWTVVFASVILVFSFVIWLYRITHSDIKKDNDE